MDLHKDLSWPWPLTVYKIKVIAHPVSIGTFWESMSNIELMEEKLCSKEEISGEME